MKKFGKALITLICVIGLIFIFGCTMLQDVTMPCHIEEQAIEYSGVEPTSYLPWTTVFDAKRIRDHIEYQHKQTQLIYKRLQEDDTLKYSFVLDSIQLSLADAQAMQEKLFNPNGSVGMALSMLFGGTIGAMFINTPKKNDSSQKPTN